MQFCNKLLRCVQFRYTRNISTTILSFNTNWRINKKKSISMATCLLNQSCNNFEMQCKHLSTTPIDSEIIDYVTYEKVCDETLESLAEYFEEIVENSQHLKSADVAYSDGVLTINFGKPFGTYVINRQTPNRQIWLSSPTSGPKRYDYDTKQDCWIYKHDGKTLHQLLQEEVPVIVKDKVDFSCCSYSLI